MRQPLYIGVTGFMTPQEVRAGLKLFPANGNRKLMVGVLVSSKTLQGGTNKWPGRYPKFDRIVEIFQDDPRAVNLIHYNTDDKETLSHQLLHLVEISGPNLHGFQLNVAWPNVAELEKFHEATGWTYRIVLQVGGGAMKKIDDNPVKLADAISEYIWPDRLIDDVLIDPSGGKGQPFDPGKTTDFLREIVGRNLPVNLGVAGGLGSQTIWLFDSLLREFPDLNSDAEGQLRDKATDDLHVEEMTDYLIKSLVCNFKRSSQ